MKVLKTCQTFGLAAVEFVGLTKKLPYSLVRQFSQCLLAKDSRKGYVLEYLVNVTLFK